MKRNMLTENRIRGLVHRTVKSVLREQEEQMPNANLTRFGRDPEEFEEDNFLQVDDVPELIQPVLSKLFEIYKLSSELWYLNQALKKGAEDKCDELNLQDVDDTLYDDIETVEYLAKKNIDDIEDIMGNCFTEYLNNPYKGYPWSNFNRSDDRFMNAGVEYHPRTT